MITRIIPPPTRTDAGYLHKAPQYLCIWAVLVYASIFIAGAWFTGLRIMGDTSAPRLSSAIFWVGLTAAEYFAECCLVEFKGCTVFPRWKKRDILQHHFPFAIFCFAALLQAPSEAWDLFRWTQSAVLVIHGNELLETLQTVGFDKWLLGPTWVSASDGSGGSKPEVLGK